MSTGQGGWGGWSGSPPSYLSDAFSNPMTVSALVTSREATVDPRQRRMSFDRAEPTRDAHALQRWEPWVRAAVAQQVLLSGIHVKKNASADARGMRTVTVSSINLEEDGQVVILPIPGPAPTLSRFDIATLVAPSTTAFRRQLELVLSWAELRQERAAEILSQIENQTAFVSAVPYLHPTRTPYTIELLGAAIQLAVNVEVRVKHQLACWRPVEYSPHVQPMITTPGHGSLPSGHCTQAYAVAHVLKTLLGLPREHAIVVQLERQAARIATNRVIAGVHFPVDSIAGRLLGRALGEYFVARCGQGAASAWHSRTFDGGVKAFEEHTVEFIPTKQSLDHTSSETSVDFYPAPRSEAAGPEGAAILMELWRLAKAEWTQSASEWSFAEVGAPVP